MELRAAHLTDVDGDYIVCKLTRLLVVLV